MPGSSPRGDKPAEAGARGGEEGSGCGPRLTERVGQVMEPVFPYARVQSIPAAASAHRLLLLSGVTGVALGAFGYVAGAKAGFWIGLALLLFVVGVIAYRRMSVTLTIRPDGVLVSGGAGSRSIRWGEVENVVALVADVVKFDSEGKADPSRDTWDALLDADVTLVMTDPDRGPQRIREIALVRRSTPSEPFFIEPVDRNAWDALMTAFEWNREHFGRPLRFDDPF